MKFHNCTQLHVATNVKKAKSQYAIEKSFITGQKILAMQQKR